MKGVDNNRLKGNLGAYLAASRLSKYCLVRPIAEGTDVGIDLHCESVVDDQPFLHFWVQVKTGESGKKIRILKNGRASFAFGQDDLSYWERQPVPVFVFLIPLDWPPSERDYEIYVINITDQLLRGNKAKTLHSYRTLRSEDDVKEFIFEDVRRTTSIQKIREGVIAPLPEIEREYVQIVPPGYSVEYVDEISRQIRRTVAFAVKDLSEYDRETTELGEKRREFTRILEVYSERLNWETQCSLGLSYRKDERYNEAKACFEKALSAIESNGKITQSKWRPIKNMLGLRISDCQIKLLQRQ